MSGLDQLHPDLAGLVGEIIHERYRVDGLLGRGGMGAVFRAHHLGLKRDVAIKVLRPELGADPTAAKRFDREAQSVSRLDHPNCVRVTDFGTTSSGLEYLVMELLEGAELEASLGQPWSAERAIETTLQILEGLEHAHHFGIVHRDLKPENVFVTRDFRGREVVKLVDFGIAKLVGDAATTEQLTRAGMVFGTPRYMSPEQATGGKLDARTDLYACGLILYEMLTGKPPFVAEEAAMLLRMHILAPPPELPPSVPPGLAAVVAKLLEKSRNDRYASAQEVIAALEAVGSSLGTPATSGPRPAPVPVPVPVPVPGPVPVPAPIQAGAHAPPGPTVPTPPPQPTHAPPVAAGAAAGAAASELASAKTGWQPAAAPLAPTGPVAVPAASAQTGASTAPGPLPPLAPTTSEAAVGGALDPSRAITHAGPSVVLPAVTTAPRRPAPARPWLPWAIGAGGLLLALMAFGAGQALRDQGRVSTPDLILVADDPRFDDDCSDKVCECSERQMCELSCGEDCALRCTDAAHCLIDVEAGSSVLCDRFGTCTVHCHGDCLVECPPGGCDVECLGGDGSGDEDEDGDKGGKGKGRKKKPKKAEVSSAKRCGTTYLCGGECDSDAP